MTTYRLSLLDIIPADGGSASCALITAEVLLWRPYVNVVAQFIRRRISRLEISSSATEFDEGRRRQPLGSARQRKSA